MTCVVSVSTFVLALLSWAIVVPVALAVSPGPPFPEPEDTRAVYDFAGIFGASTVAEAERIIDEIEARTGAEVVVYSQEAGYYGIETADTEARARALIDQWHIGRACCNDGMVVFFDMDPSLAHGQVQLYAAPGFESAYLDDSERQAIFENDMLPSLREADFDAALLAALHKVDAAATPEHASQLQTARQVNAVMGIVGAPAAVLALGGWAFVRWRRFGKDPVYLDDPSILMPAPPPYLTAAAGAMVMDGESSRRALTTAMLDLASRGLITFREENGILSRKVGIDVQPATGDELLEAQRARNARRPTGPAEEVALCRIRSIGNGSDHYVSPDDLPKFGAAVDDFDKALEQHVVSQGWYAEAPSKVVSRYSGRAWLAIGGGIAAMFAGLNIPIAGLTAIGVAIIVAGVVMLLFAQAMPAVTKDGSVIRAMLTAYRRTLQMTMEQARSMQQVVDQASAVGMTWLDTPDQAVVWGTALGLQHEIESVPSRSIEDLQEGRAAASVPYFPSWYTNSSGNAFRAADMSGSGGSIFSDSGIPDVGGMMSALSTIGNSPSSSGVRGLPGLVGGGGGGAGGGF